MTLMVFAAVLAALAQDAPAPDPAQPPATPPAAPYRRAVVPYKDLKAEDARLNGPAHASAKAAPQAKSASRPSAPPRHAKTPPRPDAPKLRPAFALKDGDDFAR